jgi:hypothetical protein
MRRIVRVAGLLTAVLLVGCRTTRTNESAGVHEGGIQFDFGSGATRPLAAPGPGDTARIFSASRELVGLATVRALIDPAATADGLDFDVTRGGQKTIVPGRTMAKTISSVHGKDTNGQPLVVELGPAGKDRCAVIVRGGPASDSQSREAILSRIEDFLNSPATP